MGIIQSLDHMFGLNSMMSGAGNLWSTFNEPLMKKQYEYQQMLQENQQNWLEQMSNTAHVREMKDLRNAGLNPLLTAIGGSGASTPGAGMGSVGMANNNPLDMLTSAMNVKNINNQNKLLKAQIENVKADTKNKGFTKEGLIGKVWDFVKDSNKKDGNFLSNFISSAKNIMDKDNTGNKIFKLSAKKTDIRPNGDKWYETKKFLKQNAPNWVRRYKDTKYIFDNITHGKVIKKPILESNIPVNVPLPMVSAKSKKHISEFEGYYPGTAVDNYIRMKYKVKKGQIRKRG